jgi:hypothetical protein
MRAIRTIIILTALLVGCEETRTILVPAPSSPPTTMEQVIASVHTIDDALARYAAGHDGHYPYPDYYHPYHGDLFEFRTVLPDSLLLVNPVTGERTEPRHIDGVHPERPAGSVIYTPYAEYDESWDWVSTGYQLTGIGPDGEVYDLSRLPAGAFDRFERVRQNCAIAMAAAEAFAVDNNGVYATNNGDVNPLGKSIMDYLPEGLGLENPVTHMRTEPQWGAAASSWGATGYVARDADGDGTADGYTIEGWGTLWSEHFVLVGGAAAQQRSVGAAGKFRRSS